MHRLIDGVLRFQREIHGSRPELFAQLGGAQAPFALFIACSDSRVAPELLTQREPGDIFVVRNAGNIIPSYGPAAGGVSASIEYAVAPRRMTMSLLWLTRLSTPRIARRGKRQDGRCGRFFVRSQRGAACGG